MRISLIFSEKAGFLRYNILSMKFGLGAIIGDKNKIVNWIHVKDLARFIKESLKNKAIMVHLISHVMITAHKKISLRQLETYILLGII